MRGIQYAVTCRLEHGRLWDTGSPACAGDDIEKGRHQHSRGTICPGFA